MLRIAIKIAKLILNVSSERVTTLLNTCTNDHTPETDQRRDESDKFRNSR